MVLQSQISSADAGETHPAVPCQDEPACRVHWARHSMHGSSELDRGLLYVVQTAFGRVVECGRVKCA